MCEFIRYVLSLVCMTTSSAPMVSGLPGTAPAAPRSSLLFPLTRCRGIVRDLLADVRSACANAQLPLDRCIEVQQVLRSICVCVVMCSCVLIGSAGVVQCCAGTAAG